MTRKWEPLPFGPNGQVRWVVIDNRFTDEPMSLSVAQDGIELYEKSAPDFRWPPLLVIPVGARTSKAEALEYAQVICDRLNTMELERALKGDA